MVSLQRTALNQEKEDVCARYHASAVDENQTRAQAQGFLMAILDSLNDEKAFGKVFGRLIIRRSAANKSVKKKSEKADNQYDKRQKRQILRDNRNGRDKKHRRGQTYSESESN